MTETTAATEWLQSSPTPVLRRLGPRLHHLYQWALEYGPYEHIWDLCCDHGRLGLHLHQTLTALEAGPRTHIHLVDCVASITDVLKDRYQHLLGPTLSVDCADAGDVALAPAGRQLLIIAGVGGGTAAGIAERLMESIAQLRERRADVAFDIMLSPNLHTFELRRSLQQHSVALLEEAFVSDKGQHHEHLLLRYQPDAAAAHKPTEVGDSLWHPLTAEKTRYIERFIKHYQACVRGQGDELSQRAVDAYKELLRDC